MPLKGIRILDLSRLLPGPYCTMLLADLGAEVIKIEEPRIGDPIRMVPPFIHGIGAFHLILNRNKKSITLNLKTDQGKQIFYKLASKSDVILEGFRPGVVQQLEIDYPRISQINPRIIYCSISGYGQSGIYRDLVGHDINYISMAGVVSLTRDSNGNPVIPGVQMADLGGGLMAAVGILTALYERERSGKGQYIDISMFDGMVSWMMMAGFWFSRGRDPQDHELILAGRSPCYNLYPTADGKYISIGCLEPWFWSNLCRELGRPDLIPHQFPPPSKSSEVFQELSRIFKTKTRDQWFQLLREKDICIAPVLSISEMLQDQHTLQRMMVISQDHPKLGKIKQLGNPIKLSRTPAQITSPAPELGEHTQHILQELGYTQEQIREFKLKGII